MPRPRTLITSTEMINAFEVARIALEDQGFFGKVAEEMDMNDEDLAALYETIMDFLEGDLRESA